MLWRCAAVLSLVLPVFAQLPTLDFGRLKPDAVVPLELEAGAAVSPDGLWIPQRDSASIVHLDARNNSPARPVAIGHAPCGALAIAFDTVWATSCDGKAVVRVHTMYGNVSATAPLPLAAPQLAVAVAASSMWVVTDAKGIVSRIDPSSNAAVAEVYVAAKPAAVAAEDDVVWVTSEAGDTLTRIDAQTNVIVETIKVGPRPGPLAIGEGAVWTLNRGDGSVSRVDSKSNKVANTIKVDESVAKGVIAVGEGAVWLSAPGVPLVRIDPRTNRVTHKFTGPGGGAVVTAHGSLWVNAGPQITWRVDPKLVAALRPE
jgi:virginiamycin B lyase